MPLKCSICRLVVTSKVYRETIERCIGWRLAGIIAVNLDNEEVIGELYQEMAHYRIAVAVVKDVPR
jgi:hypothetical protein